MKLSFSIKTIFAIFSTVIFINIVIAQKKYEFDLGKTTSPDKVVRQQGLHEICQTLDGIENHHLSILNDRKKYVEKQRETIIMSIKILGKMRSQKSSPVLVEMINFEIIDGFSHLEDGRPVPFHEAYPAVAALIQIGDWNTVIDGISVANDEMSLVLLTKTIKSILGKSLTFTILTGRLNDTKDEKKRQKLINSLEKLDKLS